MTPTEEIAIEEILRGVVHVDVDIGPEPLQGSLVGGEGATVEGPGGASLVVPAGALADTTAASVASLNPAEVDFAFEGLALLGGVEVDLSGESLSSPGKVSLSIGTLASQNHLFAARYVSVNGQRRLSLLGPAAFDDARISTGSVDSEGTYFFFQSEQPLALVSGTVSEGGSPAEQALVESSTAPFVDLTASNGSYLVAGKLAATTVTARSLVTGNQGSGQVTPPTTDPVSLDIALTSTGPFVTQMRPADGERGVPMAPAITATFSEPVNPATLATTSFVLRISGGAVVPGRVVAGAGNRSASYLPNANLEPLTSYEIELNSAITDVTGNGLLPVTTTFTTLDDTVATFDVNQVKVSFPDAQGVATVSSRGRLRARIVRHHPERETFFVYIESKFSPRPTYTVGQREVIPQLVPSGDAGLIATVGPRAGTLQAGQKIRVVFQGDVWNAAGKLLGQE